MATASAESTTYHCLCAQFLLATAHNLISLPRRAQSALDQAHILPLSANTTKLVSLSTATEPVIIRREDGFEKRWLASCARCGLVAGYYLEWAQFPAEEGQGRREDVLYVLPGALSSTEDMKRGIRPEQKTITFELQDVA